MDLLPGDVGFATIGGRTGALVNIGQALLRDSCRYTHARIVVGTYKGGAVEYLEAMPSGARIVSTPDPASAGAWWRLPLDDRQRGGVSALGGRLAGTPYSFADYGALAAQQWVPDSRLAHSLRSYVSSSGHMICSQTVDHLLCRAGYHLFNDGRLPQDVTPGDLFYACSDQGTRVL